LQALPEDFLYTKLLPEGVLTVDERGLLQAILGGYQDRVGDLRAYASKYELFFQTSGLPEEGSNVVLVTFTSDQGKLVTRSLDIQGDTPPADQAVALRAWAVAQAGVSDDVVQSVEYGVDLLRLVDANTLTYLAATVGAVLYETAAQSGSVTSNQQKILETWFPRLKIKGTAQSFDSLGRLIGFDDVRMTPLWGRLSPRLPSDVGSPVNDPDFASGPEYFPQQQISLFYNPHEMDDGPFYDWSGTVSADPESPAYYPKVVNTFNPWVKVVASGTVGHPVVGSYVLAGGGPHVKASVEPGEGLLFQALAEGDSFNGLVIAFADLHEGTDRVISISDRLSAIKYRTSYFDLGMTVEDTREIGRAHV